MGLQFYEKLDFLMKITSTTNSALSMNINLDASHISRLRRGKRNAPKDETCIKLMADYFTRHCREEYQYKALADAMEVSVLPANESRMSQSILQWLMNGKKEEVKKVETFLAGLSNAGIKPRISTPTNWQGPLPDVPDTDISVFYGDSGKQQAVLYFLSEVLAQSKPRTLLLYSDEATDWMTSDRAFTEKWAMMMMQMLAKGNRIIVIHTVSRDLDEMLSAISQWMPLYMSGAIEPYYYPKKRDGIFKRTLFLAPEVSAVTSSSVGNMQDQAANLLIRKRETIRAFEEEFRQYLFLCSPLMRIFTEKDADPYFDMLLEFEKKEGDSILMTESLSFLTMPEPVALSMLARTDWTSDQIPEIVHNRTRVFEEILQNNSFTEIIRIFDVDTVKKGEIKVAFSLMMGGGAACYTAEEYILHLENVVRLLDTQKNFHVHIVKTPRENRYMVYAKENVGAIVAKTSAPPVALGIKENNMRASFWDFLKHIIGEKAYRSPDNKAAAEKLNGYIRRLKRI